MNREDEVVLSLDQDSKMENVIASYYVDNVLYLQLVDGNIIVLYYLEGTFQEVAHF